MKTLPREQFTASLQPSLDPSAEKTRGTVEGWSKQKKHMSMKQTQKQTQMSQNKRNHLSMKPTHSQDCGEEREHPEEHTRGGEIPLPGVSGLDRAAAG